MKTLELAFLVGLLSLSIAAGAGPKLATVKSTTQAPAQPPPAAKPPQKSPPPTAAETQEAIRDTKELLESPKARKEESEKNPNAKRADQMVNRITGGSESMNQDIYELASKVFERIAQEAKGDPKVMQELLLKFQNDPAGFAGSWTPEERAKLKSIAGQMQAPPASQK